MDKYEKLKNTIDKYFNLEDFISNDKQINAYELYQELNNRFSLQNVYREKLKKIINKYYIKKLPKIIFGSYDISKPNGRCNNVFFP